MKAPVIARSGLRFTNTIAIGSLIVFGLIVLSPFYRSSGLLPTHSSIKWDTMMLHLPRLIYASDAWNNAKELPLWNPFQDIGFPYIVDPQSQLWSPVTWLVILWTGYWTGVLQTQLVIMFLVAGLGCFAAARALGQSRVAAWLAGASYMFCGYLATNAGLFGTFCTMAYFPWAVACIVCAARRGAAHVGWMTLGGLVLAQCTVGGHPTTAFIGAVNLTVLWLAFSSRTLSRTMRVRMIALLALIAAAAAWPQIQAILWAAKKFGALQPYTLARVEADALPARSLLAFLLPEFAYLSPFAYQSTYPAHLGCYPGMAALLGLFLVVARRRRPRPATILLFAAAANLLLAMGPASSLRQLIYFFIPGMSGPHHASMDFRGFAMLEGILAAGWGWTRLFAAIRARRTQLLGYAKPLSGLLFALLGAGIVATVAVGTLPMETDPAFRAAEAPAPNGGILLTEMLFRQAAVIGALMLVLSAAARAKPRRAMLFLGIFVALDMSSAMKRTWTITADVVNPSIYDFQAEAEAERALGFRPQEFLTFREEEPRWMGSIIHEVELHSYNPPLTLIDDVSLGTMKGLEKRFCDYLPERAALVDERGNLYRGCANIVALGPNSMKWKVAAPEENLKLRVLSSWFEGWKYRVNDGPEMEMPPSEAGQYFLQVPVPHRNSTVTMRFAPPWVRPAIIAMFIGYGSAILIAAISFLRNRRHA